MPVVLPAGVARFYSALTLISPRKPRSQLTSLLMAQLRSVNASASSRAVPAKRPAAASVSGWVKTDPARAGSASRKSPPKPKAATTGRSSGRPASRPPEKRKQKVKTKTSYYVRSSSKTFSLGKITAERSEKTLADRQR